LRRALALDRKALRVLITGASTGLGLAIAKRLLATTRHRLVLTAREASLPRFAAAGIEPSERVLLRTLDVVDARQRRAVIGEVNATWDGIDVLINNAGLSYRSVVEHVTDADRLEQMDINFLAPMELARLVLPRMRAQCWGRILNVSSVGGMMAMPTMSTYSQRPRLRVQATFDAYLFTVLRRLVPQRIYHAILYRALPRVAEWGAERAHLAAGHELSACGR
jgi:short-subunit dehydrogenase